MRELDFQKWLTEHNPKDEMLWKESYWKAYVFWRDKILPMFSDEFYKEHYKISILLNKTKGKISCHIYQNLYD